MSLAGARLLARWCPAERRREPDQAALVWNGRKRGPILPPHQDGERESPLRPKAGGLSTDAGAQADWLVVAVKSLLSRWGVKRRGQVIRDMFIRSTGLRSGRSRVSELK